MAKNRPPKPMPDVKPMYQLAEHYSEASRLLDDQARGDGWGCSAPSMLVESFTVELYLKCVYVLDMGATPPVGHDWEELRQVGTITKKSGSVVKTLGSTSLTPPTWPTAG